MNRRGVGPVVNLVVDRRAADRHLALGDIQSRLAGPVIVIVTADRYRNGISPRVGELRHVGVDLAAVGVDDVVAVFKAGNRERVRLAVIDVVAAGEGDIEICGGNVRLDRFADRSDVVRRVVAGKRVGHRHVLAGTDCSVGKDAVGRHRHLVTDDRADKRAGVNDRAGRPVVNLILRRGGPCGDRQLKRGDRRLVARRRRVKNVVPRRGAGESVSNRHIVKSGVLPAERAAGGHFDSVTVDDAVNVAERDFGISIAVIHLVGNRRAGHGDDRLRDRSFVGACFGNQFVVRNHIVVARQFVTDRHGIVAGVGAAERTGVTDRDLFAVQDPLDRAEMNRRGVGPVVNLVVDRRAADRHLALGDIQSRLAGPVIVIVTADRYRNGISPRVGELRHVGVDLAAVGVDDVVAVFKAGNRERVLLAVVDVVAAGEGNIEICRGDVRLNRFADRSGVVRRISAGKRVGHRHVLIFPDCSVGKDAAGRHRHLITADRADNRTGVNDRVGRPVVNFILRRGGPCGNRQLKRGDRRLVARRRRVENVVPRRGAGKGVGDVDIVESGVLRAERAGSGHADVVAVDDAVNIAERDFGVRAAVIHLVGNRRADDGDRARGNRSRVGLRFGNQFVIRNHIVVALKRVGDRHVVVTDRTAAECAAIGDRHFFAVQDPLDRAEMNRRGVGPVVNLVVDRRAADRHLALGNREGRLAGPVAVIVTADRYRNSVRPRVGKRRHVGVDLAAVGVDDVVVLFKAGNRERVRLAVVDVVAAGEGNIEICGDNVRLDRFADRSDVVRRVVAGKRVGHRHVLVFPGFRVGERAGGSHQNVVADDHARRRAERDDRVGRPVVDLILRLGAADRQLQRRDRRTRRGRRRIEDVVPRRPAGKGVGDVDIVESDVLLAERAERADRNIVAVDDAVNVAERDFGFCIAVVHLVGNRGAGHRDRARGDFGLNGFLIGGENVVPRVGAVERVADRHVALADVNVGERAGVVDDDLVAGQNPGRRPEVNRRGVGRVVDLAVGGCAGDRNLARGNGQGRVPVPVLAVGPGHLRVNLVGARVGVGGHFGDIVGLAVERVADRVGRIDPRYGEGVLLPVIGERAAGERDRTRGRSGDFGTERLAGRGVVVPRLRARDRVGNVNVMHADTRVGELAGSADRDVVAANDTDRRAGRDRRTGRSVVDLVVRDGAGDRNLKRRDRHAGGGAVGSQNVVPRR